MRRRSIRGDSVANGAAVTKKLVSQVAILTGSARGLGIALVERFAADGASLLLADVNGEDLPQVAANALDTGAPDVAWIEQDLSREEGAAATVKMALDRWGRVDVLDQQRRRRVDSAFPRAHS